ncbi:MAG: redoxin domain-containing protein [Proteobacteria bacterium]|nr:redoxin domain-containing protein [Pseudomonadota bacterium]
MRKLQPGDAAPDFIFQTPWSGPQRFHETAAGKPSLLLFLRYLGCPVCQMEMARLKAGIHLFEAEQAGVFVVLQSMPETVAASANEADWPFTIVCDPEGDIFSRYGVAPGGLRYLHPAGMAAAIKATVKGFRHGRFEGKETQLPAVFGIDPKHRIISLYYGRHPADIPSPENMAAMLPTR